MIRKYINQLRLPLLAGVSALTCASVTEASEFNFTLLDSDIRVGDNFEVAFTGTFDSELELSIFAFDVDPLGNLLTNGIVHFTDWSVPAPLEGFSFGDPEVGALGDPFEPFYGGTDIRLATLNFIALSEGSETVSISGLLDSGQGLSLYDYNTDSFFNVDIAQNFSFTVTAVPEPAVLGIIPIFLLFLFGYRKRIHPRSQ